MGQDEDCSFSLQVLNADSAIETAVLSTGPLISRPTAQSPLFNAFPLWLHHGHINHGIEREASRPCSHSLHPVNRGLALCKKLQTREGDRKHGLYLNLPLQYADQGGLLIKIFLWGEVPRRLCQLVYGEALLSRSGFCLSSLLS